MHLISKINEWPIFRIDVPNPTGTRTVLLGDAAHSIHPLAGQGLNLSLRDCLTTLTAIRNCLKIGNDLGDEAILEFYKKGNSDGLSIDIRGLSNKTIDKILEKKIDLIIWTLNSMERLKELSKKNIQAIITDEVKEFADFLRRKN